jgi:hypothetical protein
MENPDIRGTQGTGSVLSLSAIGKQDASYLLGTDQIFKKINKQHTNFSKCQFVTTVNATPGVVNWPFGQIILVTLNPQQMGDLLTNMYLRCTLPLLQDIVEFSSVYADQPGRGILEKATFRVDTQDIETIYTDWNIIKDEIYLSADQKIAMTSLINGGQPNGTLPTSSIKSGPIELYIPLNFFFANNSETYFPVCSITQQRIVLSLTFNPVQFFSNTHTSVNYPGSQYTCGLSSFDIVCEQIVVSPEERLYFQSGSRKLLIETARPQPQLQIPGNVFDIKNFLVPNIPVESFHWFFRKSAFEQPGGDFLNRFNYSDTTSHNLNDQSLNPMMSDAIFFINGASQLGFMEELSRTNPQSAYYFKYVETNTSSLSSPTRNIYTYTFALNPRDGPLTGALDFKNLTSDKNFINISLLTTATDSYVMNMFYLGLVTLSFEGGFLTILQ